ncbi:MAG: phosphoribosyltransferase family protein [Gemmatimonadaceae bacterium]
MPQTPLYADRAAAGKAVAGALAALGYVRCQRDVVVLGLPRGGIPVARAVADALDAPLEAIVARKLGVPGLNEVAFGAISEGHRGVVEDSVRWYLGLPRRVVAPIVDRERRELERRARLYREGAPLPELRDRTVVLVDDGLASGATLRAAALAVRRQRPARVIAAVPVASAIHCDDVRATVDELVAVATPEPFDMVSTWYDDFTPTSDAEVMRLLGRSCDADASTPPAECATIDEQEIAIPLDGDNGQLIGELGVPNVRPAGLVILAHGGGSSRNSYRNRYLAGRLRRRMGDHADRPPAHARAGGRRRHRRSSVRRSPYHSPLALRDGMGGAHQTCPAPSASCCSARAPGRRRHWWWRAARPTW